MQMHRGDPNRISQACSRWSLMELPPSSRRATESRLAGVHRANPSPLWMRPAMWSESVARLFGGEVHSSSHVAADRRSPQSRLCRACPGARSVAAVARPLRRAPERTEPRVEIVESPGLRWINIERPRSLEQAWLEEHFEFHPLDYEDVRSRNQRPKVDEYDDYLFIVLHFPRYDKKVARLNAAEVDIFVGPDFLITLPNEPLEPVEYLFERCRTQRGPARAAVLQGLGLPALQDRR